MAAARRWPIIDLSAAGRRLPRIPLINTEIQRLALSFTHPLFFPFVKFDIAGVENIPESGPAIIVGNHRSYFDPMAIAVTIARTDRTVRFLGKKEVFDAPVIGQIATLLGGIRVDRGTGGDEPLQAAAEALAHGDMVTLMPQGTIPRGKAFFDPKLKGRWGAARLAAMTGAPVIPIGLWGTEKIWPRSALLPNVLNIVDPPVVTIRVGSVVPLKRQSPDADTKRIMKALMDLLPPESKVRHEPTPEELAATLPRGYTGDGEAESQSPAGNRLTARGAGVSPQLVYLLVGRWGMIERMNDTALLHELTEVAERLTARHYETCKPWYPHEFVPWGMGRDFDPDTAWDADEVPLPESLRSALFVNLLTEDNLPYYFQTIDRMFGHDGIWREWSHRWTAEEARHSIALRDFMTVTRMLDPRTLEDGRMSQMSGGQVPEPNSAVDGFVYVALQELATRIAHRNTGRALREHLARPPRR